MVSQCDKLSLGHFGVRALWRYISVLERLEKRVGLVVIGVLQLHLRVFCRWRGLRQGCHVLPELCVQPVAAFVVEQHDNYTHQDKEGRGPHRIPFARKVLKRHAVLNWRATTRRRCGFNIHNADELFLQFRHVRTSILLDVLAKIKPAVAAVSGHSRRAATDAARLDVQPRMNSWIESATSHLQNK